MGKIYKSVRCREDLINIWRFNYQSQVLKPRVRRKLIAIWTSWKTPSGC